MTRILVDPRIAFGRPYVEGHGVKAETIYNRWRGGESKKVVAWDYDLPMWVVDMALDFERWCHRRGRYDAPYAERLVRRHLRAVREKWHSKEIALPGDWPRVVWPRKGKR